MSYYDREGNPIADVIAWGKQFEDFDARVVGKEKRVEKETGDVVEVSTVWLGIDHSFGEGPPLIFETMIFGGEHDQEQWRYSTEEQAQAGHAAAVQLAFGGDS